MLSGKEIWMKQLEPAEIVAGVDKSKYPLAEELASDVLWQAERLLESRDTIKNAPIVIPYDNGGGQTGLRKNPMYDAYNSLFASFCKGFSQLTEMLADAPSAKKTISKLEEIKLEVAKTKRQCDVRL